MREALVWTNCEIQPRLRKDNFLPFETVSTRASRQRTFTTAVGRGRIVLITLLKPNWYKTGFIVCWLSPQITRCQKLVAWIICTYQLEYGLPKQVCQTAEVSSRELVFKWYTHEIRRGRELGCKRHSVCVYQSVGGNKKKEKNIFSQRSR